MNFSHKHLRMLRKASRKPIDYRQDKHESAINYLITKKVINFTIRHTKKGVVYRIATNENGKAMLYEKYIVSIRSKIAIILSIIAIVISLLTAFTPLSD